MRPVPGGLKRSIARACALALVLQTLQPALAHAQASKTAGTQVVTLGGGLSGAAGTNGVSQPTLLTSGQVTASLKSVPLASAVALRAAALKPGGARAEGLAALRRASPTGTEERSGLAGAAAPEGRWQQWLNEGPARAELADPEIHLAGETSARPDKASALKKPSADRRFTTGRIYDRRFAAEEKRDGRFTVVLDLNDTIEHHDDATGGETFRLRPGIENDLKRLADAGIKVVLWTQAERWWVENFLDRFPDLAPKFDRIITHENYMGLTPAESVGRQRLASRTADDPAAKDLSVLGYHVLIDDRAAARHVAHEAGFTHLRVRPVGFEAGRRDADVSEAVSDALSLAKIHEIAESPDGETVRVLDLEGNRAEIEVSLGAEPLVFAINRSIFALESNSTSAWIRRAAGGAAPAIYSALQAHGGGIVFSAAMSPAERALARSGKILRVGDDTWVRYVDMPADVFEKHYTGYANSILWPAQHGMAEEFAGGTPPDMQEEFDHGYKVANRAFAREIRRVLGPQSRARLMVQDYHLYLLPGMLRRGSPTGGVVQQFVHIPWPEPAYLARAMPASQLRDVLIGLLGNDIVGFQTEEYARNFLQTAAQVLGADVDVDRKLVRWAGREIWVRAYPISLDADAILATLRTPQALDTMRRLEQVKAGKKMIVRVDRIDPTKGILEGFEAFRRLLRERPSLIGKVMFYAILQPSREGNAAYRALQDRIREVVKRINHEFTPEVAARGFDGIIDDGAKHRQFLALSPDQVPAVTVRMTAVPNAEVLATMAVMDVGLVNSKADGMNLVAKEMAVANDPALLESVRRHNRRVRPGVIVASARMGAHHELAGRAITLEDPTDIRQTTDALQAALLASVSWSEKAALASRQVFDHNLARWFEAMQRDVQARAPPADLGAGHAVGILDTPEKIFYTRAAAIQRAEVRVDAADFLIRDDDASTIKMALLRERADAKLKVRQIADALHNELDPAMMMHLMERGVQFRNFNPFSWRRLHRIGIRYHEKGLGINGVEHIAGDTNTGDEYVQWGKHERMTSRDVLVRGPAARAAHRHFDKLWDSAWVAEPRIEVASKEAVARHRYWFGLRANALAKLFGLIGFKLDTRGSILQPGVRLVTREEVDAAGRRLDYAAAHWREMAVRNWEKSRGRGPDSVEPVEPTPVDRVGFVHDPIGKKGESKGIEQNLLTLIRGAKRKLVITTPYLVLTPEFREALRDALERKVKVTIVTNSLESSDNAFTQAHYELHKRELADMGLELWEFNGPGTLHAKSAVADGRMCYNGAYNVDYRSQLYSMENGHIWVSRRSARQFEARINLDQENSTLVARGGRLLEVRVRKVRFGPWAYSVLVEKQL